MKNLLIYTNPEKDFSEENKVLVKIHIDNSIQLGWSREDILLYTNFPYEYNGVKAIEVDDRLHLSWDKTSNKIFVIDDLFRRGEIKRGIYWYHDFDAYQNAKFSLNFYMGSADLAITGYGYKPQTNGGSFFFNQDAGDLFSLWCSETVKIKRTRADEKTLTDMTRSGLLTRYKMLNITYNFGQRCPTLCYDDADKPLKVLHFHPDYRYYEADENNLDIFMYGKNPHRVPMMSKRLIKIFNKHGIK